MNPSLRVDARQDLVAPETEHIFDDAMWQSLDLVCNALDNMKVSLFLLLMTHTRTQRKQTGKQEHTLFIPFFHFPPPP